MKAEEIQLKLILQAKTAKPRAASSATLMQVIVDVGVEVANVNAMSNGKVNRSNAKAFLTCVTKATGF